MEQKLNLFSLPSASLHNHAYCAGGSLKPLVHFLRKHKGCKKMRNWQTVSLLVSDMKYGIQVWNQSFAHVEYRLLPASNTKE